MKHTCGTEIERRVFDTFSYEYCPTCKVETTAPPSGRKLFLDEVVDKINNTEHKIFLYVSNSVDNLMALAQRVNESVDWSATTTRFHGVLVAGVGRSRKKYDGIYSDSDVVIDTALVEAPWHITVMAGSMELL